MGDPVRQSNEDVFMKDEGLVHEVAVTGRKVGTPDELRQFFSTLAHDERKFREVMDEVLGRTGLTESEQIAASILGSDKIAGYRAATSAWSIGLPEIEPILQFSREALIECSEENQNGHDWRVVWINGLSLRQQEKKRGRNRKKQPCFDPDYTWWLEKQQDVWGNKPIEAGYQLLDFSGRFGNIKWQPQEDEIAKLGDNFERAEEQAVAEACFTFYLASGKKERLLKNFWHWGRLLTASGSRVDVGVFDEGGFLVGNDWDGCQDGLLRVVVSRKS